MTRRLSAALLLMIALSAGRSDAHGIAASYCATVAALHSQDRRDELALSRSIAEFARLNGLRLNGVEQVDTDEYIDHSKHIVLDLTFGMGEFGSVVTLFYEGHAGDDVRVKLDQFLLQRVNETFDVRHCSDISGFETPTMSDEVK